MAHSNNNTIIKKILKFKTGRGFLLMLIVLALTSFQAKATIYEIVIPVKHISGNISPVNGESAERITKIKIRICDQNEPLGGIFNGAYWDLFFNDTHYVVQNCKWQVFNNVLGGMSSVKIAAGYLGDSPISEFLFSDNYLEVYLQGDSPAIYLEIKHTKYQIITAKVKATPYEGDSTHPFFEMLMGIYSIGKKLGIASYGK